MKDEIYNYKAIAKDGSEVNISDYKGKVLLIVNTASKCGFTPQYEGLQQLYKKYHDKGLVVLGFPCDQFGHQEPGNDEEITEFCSLNFGVSFPMFKKIDVNGPETTPLYKYLKSQLKGVVGDNIKWNFTKFLIDSKGNPVKRYAPATKPEDIEKKIIELLEAI